MGLKINHNYGEMKTKNLKQTVRFSCSPSELYSLLLDSKKMSAIHSTKTTMTRRAHGSFTVFDGYCHGQNLELIEGKKIVQAWHFKEKGWPDDHFSTCTFLMEPSDHGTRLTFTQTEVPAIAYDSLREGWYTYYWDPIKAYLQLK